MKRLLIAGFGRLGQALSLHLHKTSPDLEVFAIRRGNAVFPGTTCIQADLTKPASLTALPGSIDAIVYCPTPDARNITAYQQIFIDGLKNLTLALQPHQTTRLIFISSTAVYGQQDNQWVDEDSPCQPQRFNGKVLLQAENQVKQQYPKSCCLRLSGLYQKLPTRYLNMLSEPPSAETLGRWTNRIHIDDAAQLIGLLLQTDQLPHTIIGSDNHPEKTIDIIKWLAVNNHSTQLMKTLTKPIVNGKRISNKKALSLGFIPNYPDYRKGFSQTH